MSTASVVTRGYGPPGSVNLVVTDGYSIGDEPIVVEPSIWTPDDATTSSWTPDSPGSGTWE